METRETVDNPEHAAKMDRRWKKFQEALGYTDKEIAIYRSDPQKVKAMERASKFASYNIIAECIKSRNCNAGHKIGDRIVLDGNGVILTNQCPERICHSVIQVIAPTIYAIWERFGEDMEDASILLPYIHCPDVGVENGGWGETIWKVYAEPRAKTI